MANKFTQKAENVIKSTQRTAEELGHTYIGSEHLIIALCAEKDSVSGRLLTAQGITPSLLRKKLKHIRANISICTIRGVGYNLYPEVLK